MGGTPCVEGVGMDLQDLRTFLVVAEEPSFPAAARRLQVSEADLSERLHQVERRLGVTLFERTTSATEPTPAGAWVLSRAAAVAQEWRSTAEQARLLATGAPVGPSPDPAAPDLAPVRLAVPEMGPGNIQEYLSRSMSARRVVAAAMPQVEALERLGTGDGVDVVLVYDIPDAPAHPLVGAAHMATLTVEPLWVLMGARHPLADQDEVTVEEVVGWGLAWVVGPKGDRLRPWEEAFLLGQAPRAQLREVSTQSQVDISQGRAVALASPDVPTTELLTLRPLVPTASLHVYLTWEPQRVSATVAAELLTAMRGFMRRCAQRNPRYWRWVCEHPDAFPGIAPAPLDPVVRVTSAPPGGPVDGLTSREREVLALVAAGLDNSEIARELHLSPSTAKNHVMSIRTKLGARDRVQLVVLAHRHHLLD